MCDYVFDMVYKLQVIKNCVKCNKYPAVSQFAHLSIYIIKVVQLVRLPTSPKKFHPSDPLIYDITFIHVNQNEIL
jgi:hypothetical protein